MNQSDSQSVQNQRDRYVWNEPGRYGAFRPPLNSISRARRDAVLYFVGDDGPLIKIGIAANLEKRLYTLRAGNPRLALRAHRTIPRALDRQIEALVHEALADYAAGREWFSCSVEMALKAAKPIIDRGTRVYSKMMADGLFGIE